MSQYLTVAEIAAELRVSKMTVYRIVNDGELPSLRVGRSFRVTREALDDYLRRNSSEPTTPAPYLMPAVDQEELATVDGGGPDE